MKEQQNTNPIPNSYFGMGMILRLEELAMLIFSILLFSLTIFEWWWFLVLILLPDIGMLGYLLNNNFGAFTYNIFHHKGIALLVMLLGYLYSIEWIIVAGIILLAHASLDRLLGFGLKYPDNFKHTHLDHF